MIDLKAAFDKFDSDFLKFELIETPLSRRPDLHAFLLLDKIMPGARDMVSAAEHDQIWLEPNCEELAKIITEDQVRELRCCGVIYDGEYDSLYMFA